MATRGRARNGQGTISPRKLADGTTVYDAWTPSLPDPETGKNRRRSQRGFATEKLAAEWISKTVNAIEGGQKAEARQSGPTVDKVSEQWSKVSTRKPSTIAAHLYNYQNMASPIIGKLPIREVLSTDIDALFAKLAEKYSPGVLVLLVRALGNFWEYAVRAKLAPEDVIKASPWRTKVYQMEENRKAERQTEKEDTDGGLIRVFTPEQANLLIEMERNELYRRYWHFVLLTGCRRGEGLGLRWSDVDFEKKAIRLSDNTVHVAGGIMTVDTPKGNRKRRIYVPDEVLDLLREQQRFIARERRRFGDEWQDHDLVFPAAFKRRNKTEGVGGHLDPKAISETFLRRCRTLGLPEIKLHGLRHTWASAAYAAGVDLKTIQDHLGHRVDITTLVYVHVDTETKREATVRVVDWLRAA